MAKELTSSVLSNCVDKLNILQTPSTFKCKNNIPQPGIVRVPQTDNVIGKELATNTNAIEAINALLNQPEQSNSSDPFSFNGSDITISYLAGSIEKKIMSSTRTNCVECQIVMQNIFKENFKFNDLHVKTKNSPTPCESTVEICRIANEYLRVHACKIDFQYNRLLNDIIDNIEIELYEETDFSHDLQHKSDLIRFVIEEFIRYRATYIAQKITLHEKQKLLRRKNRKLVHFAGE